jgi:hypothetical protein
MAEKMAEMAGKKELALGHYRAFRTKMVENGSLTVMKRNESSAFKTKSWLSPIPPSFSFLVLADVCSIHLNF